MKKKLPVRPKARATGFVHCGFTSPQFVQCSLPIDHPTDLQHRFNGLPDDETIQVVLAKDATFEELLSVGNRRDEGVLASLSRSELQLIAPETIDLEMSREQITRIARFHLQRAWKVKHNVTDEELAKIDETARYWIIFDIKNSLAALAAKAGKTAQRRASTMADETNDVVAGSVQSKKAKKAAKKAPAKAAAKKAPAKNENGGGRKANTEVYETMVVATAKEAREGTFAALVQKAAAKPIKMETLIQKLAKDVELRSEKDAETVVRVRVRDFFTRHGFLKAAKA